VALIFLNKADSHPEWLNPKWVQFALENEGELKDRYPGTYNATYMDTFRQQARDAGMLSR